uniref:C-type lectin domain-containing protein n=1 Tax=Oryzias latipes TaxID=8090 RepID=A0A3B3I9G2_ORYLA
MKLKTNTSLLLELEYRTSQILILLLLHKNIYDIWKTGCPEKWSRFGSSCYFLREESKTWDEAREFCRAKEADLVVINSKEENEFISKLKKQDVWLGLSDRDLEGTWKWVDGSSLTLQFWASDQPDNIGGVEDCAHTNFEFPGLWNDVPCQFSKQLICEKE